MKLLIDIKGELFDMWEVRTITRYDEYNSDHGDMDYYIQLNREGKATNAENILIKCESEDDRESTLKQIKIKLSEQDTVMII